MGLRTTSSIDFDRNNYCHILNITNAILSATAKIDYDIKIPCIKQTKIDMCKNMQLLFKNSYVIPIPQYTQIVNILQNSVMNILECTKVDMKTLHFNYEIIPLIILFIFILIIVKKNKLQ